MKCLECGGEDFSLESSIVVKETYKIYKNGNRSFHPQKTEITNEDMTDNENIVRCINCNQGYVLKETNRYELLYKIDYKKIDLAKEGVITKY